MTDFLSMPYEEACRFIQEVRNRRLCPPEELKAKARKIAIIRSKTKREPKPKTPSQIKKILGKCSKEELKSLLGE